jgi:hypothetical protein
MSHWEQREKKKEVRRKGKCDLNTGKSKKDQCAATVWWWSMRRKSILTSIFTTTGEDDSDQTKGPLAAYPYPMRIHLAYGT